jgi:hypothetical protein
MKVRQSDLIKRTAKKEAKLPRSFPIGINLKSLSVQSILLGKSENLVSLGHKHYIRFFLVVRARSLQRFSVTG